MKSPEALAARLKRQWYNATTREQRLSNNECWPIQLPIGKPSSQMICEGLEQVRTHLQTWRAVQTGTVHWRSVSYRSTGEAIEIPITWEIKKPSEWIAATGDKAIHTEFQKLARIIAAADVIFHSLLLRQRHLILDKSEAEVIKSCEVATLLEPGCAQNAPLRALSLAGIDSKFFERNQTLMVKLLDCRFAGLATELGLANFLGALAENDHWLLLVDLDGDLLPLQQQRVRDNELLQTALTAEHIVIVENERCVHLLPPLKHTVAILGAGLNLSWMCASWLGKKQLAYWGDIDTWGLTMLARARQHQPTLTPVLMTLDIYKKYAKQRAIPEPVIAGMQAPTGLTMLEHALYSHLLNAERGRLEQEFLPRAQVEFELINWHQQNILGTSV